MCLHHHSKPSLFSSIKAAVVNLYDETTVSIAIILLGYILLGIVIILTL